MTVDIKNSAKAMKYIVQYIVHSTVPVQLKTVDSIPDKKGIPPKTVPRTICIYAFLSWNLFLK